MKTKFLGKNNLDKNLKGKYLLDEIKREKSLIKYGHDIWNIYDTINFFYFKHNFFWYEITIF